MAAKKYLGASWVGPDRRGRVLFYGEWRQGRSAENAPTFHNPTICFPASGCRLERNLGEVTVRVGGREIPFNGYLFSRASQHITAYFTIWDVDEQDPVRPLTWREYWAERLGNVLKRRSQFRMQLVTLAFVEEGDRATPLSLEQVRAEIEKLLKPLPEGR